MTDIERLTASSSLFGNILLTFSKSSTPTSKFRSSSGSSKIGKKNRSRCCAYYDCWRWSLSLSRISRRLNLDPDSIWIWTYSITGQQVTCTHRILIRCTLILISWVLLLSFFDYWKLNLWQNSAGTPEGIKTLIENSVLNLQINNSFIQIDRLKHFDVLIIICLHSTTIEISSVYHKALTIILTEDTN
jgi:hypothetical protein